jgi:hypothetical protein
MRLSSLIPKPSTAQLDASPDTVISSIVTAGILTA